MFTKKIYILNIFILIFLSTIPFAAGQSVIKNCTGSYPDEQDGKFYLLYIDEEPFKEPYYKIKDPKGEKDVYFFPATPLLKALKTEGTYDKEKDMILISGKEFPREYAIIGRDIKTDNKILYLSFYDLLNFLNLPVITKQTGWGESIMTMTDPAYTSDVYNNQIDANSIIIPLNSMIELDFKSRSEIYDIRKNYVSQHGELLNNNYNPSDAVFGQIEDGKPWWGIQGIYYYGNGTQSIEGPSEESRFIINPFLLIGVIESNAYVLPVPPAGNIEPPYPKPSKLVWNSEASWLQVVYNVSEYFKSYPSAENKLTLVAYNARDMGYNYLHIVPEQSTNLTFVNTGNPVVICQFLHCGTSCGYPGGGNNMSPYQAELEITVQQVPARAYIKLWKNAPASVTQNGDKIIIIEMF